MRWPQVHAPLLMVALVVLMLGCSTRATEPATAPAPAPELPPPPPPAPAAPAEQFDPARWTPPETGPSPEAERVLATLPEPGRVPLPSDLPTTAPVPIRPSVSPEVDCHEVQLLASAERSRAEEASRVAASRFGLPAHIVSGEGLYRVRVGGCLGEGQAEVVRDTARRLGYGGAYVVRTME